MIKVAHELTFSGPSRRKGKEAASPGIRRGTAYFSLALEAIAIRLSLQ
jgi:hypothetical protein